MTRISGYDLSAASCCGATYITPRYASMNFSAFEYWTDGYREGSLMPNDQGLRRCKCGNVFLLPELVQIMQVTETEAPFADRLENEDLPLVIVQARTPAIERAARVRYWQALNHAYRERYRAHRNAEEAATKAVWDAENPDTRTLWQRFRRVPPPKYTPSTDRPFTYPPFEATAEQRDNMKSLLQLIVQDNDSWVNLMEVAELHRELGEFEEASQALQAAKSEDHGPISGLIGRLVKEKQTAPMRYML